MEDQRRLVTLGSMGKVRVTPKRRKIPKSLDSEALKIFDRNWSIICEYCFYPVSMDDFKTPESLKEYNISGLCALCQDDIHNGVR